MAHRYFTTQITEETACITGEDARHLSRVLRTRAGEVLTLCDGKGFDYQARVETVSDEQVTFQILKKEENVSEPSVEVTLYVGYPKGDKLELVIQKAVELGAVRIVPFFSRFCVAAPKKEEQKNVRYNRIAYEAAKQAGRGVLPQVELPLTFVQMLQEQNKYDLSLFCYEAAKDAPSLQTRLQQAKTVSIITGAEGGFSEEEAVQAKEICGEPLSLGTRILRCETAPLAALSAVMAFTGNLE